MSARGYYPCRLASGEGPGEGSHLSDLAVLARVFGKERGGEVCADIEYCDAYRPDFNPVEQPTRRVLVAGIGRYRHRLPAVSLNSRH